MSSDVVRIYEIALTDGLLTSEIQPSVEIRSQIVEMLVDSGLSYVEVAALRAENGEPIDRDAFECAQRVAERAEVIYAGLLRDFGSYALFRQTSLDTLSIRLHAREQVVETIGADWGVSQAMLALDRMEIWFPSLIADGYRVRACVYDALQSIELSSASPDDLVECARGLVELGCFQVSFGDSYGTASPREVRRVAEVLLRAIGTDKVAFQLSDTLGRGIVNFWAAWKAGVRHFDTALSGIGRSPLTHEEAPAEASAYLATEDLVAFCDAEGLETGIDLQRLVRAGRFATERLGLSSHSRYAAACDGEGRLRGPSPEPEDDGNETTQ